MKKELDKSLLIFNEKCKNIKNHIKKLEEEYDDIRIEAMKKIINTWIDNKDFHDFYLVLDYRNQTRETDEPIFMELECFTRNTQELIYAKREELNDLMDDYFPEIENHFEIKINDFVSFYGVDYEYGFKFNEFNPEKIKAFAKEYGLKIKLHEYRTVEMYDESIKKLVDEKNNLIKYKEIFVCE